MYTSTKRKNSIPLPRELKRIFNSLHKIGAKPILVGGCVRDHFLKKPIKDYDVEVFNLPNIETLRTHLASFGSVKVVGKSFGVLKLNTCHDEYDFALPRTEKKVGSGHTGFDVTTNANLSFKEASKRRDFTMNAIGYDVFEELFLDPYDGIEDIYNRRLKHIDDTTFIEDPLRIYRAIQFCARFELNLDDATLLLCQSMVHQGQLEELPKTRVFDEFKKFLLKSPKPSLAFELMNKMGILTYFPQLESLMGCEQEPEYHPEGDVWIHTLMCLDEMAYLRTKDEYQNLYLMLAILCHDFGKPQTTKVINGRITSYNHEKQGVEPTLAFLKLLTDEKKLIEKVIPLVEYHLAPFQLFLQNSSIKAVKRLATKANIEELCIVALADCKGRTIPNKDKCDKAIEWLLKCAKELNVQNEQLKPLVQGRDLIKRGLSPSSEFKKLLNEAYEIQLENAHFSKEEILKELKY